MKKIILIATVVTVFVACKSKSTLDANKNMVLVDTTGLSLSNGSTDVSKNNADVNTNNNAGITPARRRTNNGTNAGSSNNGNSNTSNQGTSTVPAKEKGWSDAAKGTAIGAGSGAVLGAILSKNKAKGAVIGGVIGGAGGCSGGHLFLKSRGGSGNQQ